MLDCTAQHDQFFNIQLIMIFKCHFFIHLRYTNIQTHLHLGWREGEFISANFIFGWIIILLAVNNYYLMCYVKRGRIHQYCLSKQRYRLHYCHPLLLTVIPKTMNQDILEWIISCPFTFLMILTVHILINKSFGGKSQKKEGKPVILASGDEVEFRVVSV